MRRDPVTFIIVLMEPGLFVEFAAAAQFLLAKLQRPAGTPSPAALGYTDANVYSANVAAYVVLDHLGEYREIPDPVYARCDVLALGSGEAAANDLAAFARRIGRERATPAVAAQQLKIDGYFDQADLHPTEELIVSTFLRTLFDLDDFDQAEEARAKTAAEKPQERPPVPIEDTTMEPVADPMETF